MSIWNIPHELRKYPQWIVWRYDNDDKGKPTKLPYSPVYKGRWASVSKPDTWSDFDTAAKLYLENVGIYQGIGFVLTSGDPYCFIDLDDAGGDVDTFARQKKVYDTFKTYSETSPSGRGLHIICRASVPQGRKRSKIEIYSDARWLTFTGNATEKDMPIADCSELALTLWSQMGKDAKGASTFYDPKAPQTESDEAVIEQAANAANSDLFLDLMRGDYTARYPSQSEADQALINVIAYYTQNRDQIIRIFHRSGLGQRDKAKRSDYLRFTINRAFDMMLPPIDLEGMAEASQTIIAERQRIERDRQEKAAVGAMVNPTAASHSMGGNEGESPPDIAVTMGSGHTASRDDLPLHLRQRPPGLLGNIAQFIFEQSPRAVPEAGLVAAIGFMAALCGRCYNVTGSGLNQYVLFLAQTGAGKESIGSGIDKILRQARQQVPNIDDFFGPSDIGSGQAVLKALDEQQCFLSIVGEFDNMLKAMTAQNANSAMLMLKKVILDLYQKSGRGRVSRRMIYSDQAKNTTNVDSPAFSILGECTPQLLFANVDDSLIASGLLPRFTIIEYKGKINYLNKSAFQSQPSEALVNDVCTLADMCLRMNMNREVIDVQIEPAAEQMLDAFERHCTDKINETTQNVQQNLWNRAHLKTLKLAATIAVGCNPWQPVINMQIAEYARSLIVYDISNLLERFAQGSIGAGSDEMAQHYEAKRVLASAVLATYNSTLSTYGITSRMHELRTVPNSFFSRRLSSMAVFRKDRVGPAAAVKRAVRQLVDEGVITEVSKIQASKDFETTTLCFAVTDIRYLLDYHKAA